MLDCREIETRTRRQSMPDEYWLKLWGDITEVMTGDYPQADKDYLKKHAWLDKAYMNYSGILYKQGTDPYTLNNLNDLPIAV